MPAWSLHSPGSSDSKGRGSLVAQPCAPEAPTSLYNTLSLLSTKMILT